MKEKERRKEEKVRKEEEENRKRTNKRQSKIEKFELKFREMKVEHNGRSGDRTHKQKNCSSLANWPITVLASFQKALRELNS